MRWLKNRWLWTVLIVAMVALQLVPVDRENPPVLGAPEWDSPRTEALARRACFDCHSNETAWPLYSYVAPVSLLIAHHVEEGRAHVNFSVPPFGRKADECAEVMEEGEMPVWPYDWIHRTTRHLNKDEKTALIEGFKATFGKAKDEE